jgi:hypothetical protein
VTTLNPGDAIAASTLAGSAPVWPAASTKRNSVKQSQKERTDVLEIAPSFVILAKYAMHAQ